jgi:hypothetical protein
MNLSEDHSDNTSGSIKRSTLRSLRSCALSFQY